jgi:hypothetical protein
MEYEQDFSHFERRRIKSERGYSQQASFKRSFSFFMRPPQRLAETLMRGWEKKDGPNVKRGAESPRVW